MAYLDHAATTPLRPQAREAMLPWLGERTGNPSGAHRAAREARRAVDDARDVLAELTGFAPGEITFTGGGTEADNLAVLGVLDAVSAVRPGSVAACPATEHHAVLDAGEWLAGHEGAVLDVLPVDAQGRADPAALGALLADHGDEVAVVAEGGEISAPDYALGFVDQIERTDLRRAHVNVAH